MNDTDYDLEMAEHFTKVYDSVDEAKQNGVAAMAEGFIDSIETAGHVTSHWESEIEWLMEEYKKISELKDATKPEHLKDLDVETNEDIMYDMQLSEVRANMEQLENMLQDLRIWVAENISSFPTP